MTWIETVATNVVSTGGIGGLLFFALRDRLRDLFQTKEDARVTDEARRKDIDAMGARITGNTSLVVMAKERADDAHAIAEQVRATQESQWERLTEVVVEPMNRMTTELTAQGKVLAAMVEAVSTLKAAK